MDDCRITTHQAATEPIPLTMEAGGVDLFSIQANGDICVRGKVVTDDAEIVRGLRSAVAELNKKYSLTT